MISRLRGILISKKPPYLLLEVQGVGYEVQAPLSTIFRLPDLGKELILHIEFVVREDAHKLFGFLTEFERELFNIITKVSGVGPKLGLAILSGLTPEQFVRTIQISDVASLVRLPGVGKKTAERLVVELKDKLADISLHKIISSMPNMSSTASDAGADREDLGNAEGTQDNINTDTQDNTVNTMAWVQRMTPIQDAKDALVALGYSVKEANQTMMQIPPEKLQDASSEAIIKMALSRLMKMSV